MFFKKENNKKILEQKIDWLIDILEKSNLKELIVILGSKKQIILNNILAGISRGVGIGIGITIITALIIILLNKIVTWNIPVIGKYLADIVEIVEKSR